MPDNNDQLISDNMTMLSSIDVELVKLSGAVNPNGTTSLKSIKEQEFIAECLGTTREQIMSSPYIHNENEGKQEINLIISDLDNTLIDAYSDAAQMFLDLEKYIAQGTGYTVARTHNILRKEINTEKHFTSAEFFSVDGYKKVLASPIWGGMKVSGDIVAHFDEGFQKSYSCTYPDALEIFKKLHSYIPIVIHTDAPLEQAMDKLIKGGFISLKRDASGKLHATSLVAGISASNRSSSKDPIAQAKANRQMAELKEALKEIDVFVFAYDKEFEKPSPKPLEKILSELQKSTGLTFAKENILMMGDSLSKDIAFAINAGIKSAWMLGCTRASDNVRHLEHASSANRHAMSWQKQFKFFYRKVGSDRADKIRELLADTTICISHNDLLKKYIFKPQQQKQQQNTVEQQQNIIEIKTIKNLIDEGRTM